MNFLDYPNIGKLVLKKTKDQKFNVNNCQIISLNAENGKFN